jgi:diguanylate cyclase (GGDEF)-like protein/PAS domain S-box-containing protein
MLRRLFQRETPTISRGVWRLFSIATCTLLVLIGLLVGSFLQIFADRAAVARTTRVQGQLLALGEDVLDAESGQRGYLLTQNDEYLSHFHSGAHDARRRLVELHELITEPDLQQQLARLDPVVNAKLAELADTVRLTANGRRDEALSIVMVGGGLDGMNEFRDIRSWLLQMEQRKLDSQRASLRWNTYLTLLMLVVGGGAVIVTLFFETRRMLRKLGAPVHELLQAMVALSHGESRGPLAVRHGDEIGQMAAAFNVMSDGLATSRDACQGAMQALELSHARTVASEQRLQMITEQVPALISHVDRDLRYHFVNRRFQECFEPGTSALAGDACLADDATITQRVLAGETVSLDRDLKVHGVVRHFNTVMVPERDGDGAVVGVFTFHTDITSRRDTEIALRKSQSFLDRSGAVAGVGGWEIDLRDRSVTWSRETYRLHEVEPDYQPSFSDGVRFYAKSSRGPLTQAIDDCINQGKPWDLELEIISAKGRRFWARATGVAEIEAGVAVRLVGAFQDISERRRLEQKLADSTELLRVTLESIGDAVITTDKEGTVQWMNPVAEQLTGCSRQDARAQELANIFKIVRSDTRVEVKNPVELCLELGRTVALGQHTTLQSRNGSEYGIEDTAAPIRDADGRVLGAVLVFHDVTEQRRLIHEIHHRAAHDALTGLVNRAEFEERVGRLLANTAEGGREHVLMFVDLDEFKVVNDACGHAAGDLLLRQISILLQTNTRSRDTVARLGGDEFGIILENCNLARGHQIAQKICDQMDSYRFVHEERRYRIGASIGVVPVDARWPNSTALIQAADSCCYSAKEEGRNRIHAWIESDGTLLARQVEMQWARRLETAIDEHRFVLFAQQIEPIDGESTGLHCEVLLRLQQDDGALALPGAFLPAAERFHLATRIDRWVVSRVFEQLSDPATAMGNIDTVAINLSGQSLSDRDFHRFTIQLLRDAKFDIRKLCFEITETAAITRLGDAKLFIQEVRSLGPRIALDDFGAGASSFGYLRTLPVDYLKIDGRFVGGVLKDPLDNAAVRCFCEVAKVLNIKTVAECVEAPDVCAALRDLGVNMAQGHLIHQPEPLCKVLPFKKRTLNSTKRPSRTLVSTSDLDEATSRKRKSH